MDRADTEIKAWFDDIAWYLLRRVSMPVHDDDAGFTTGIGWLIDVFDQG